MKSSKLLIKDLEQIVYRYEVNKYRVEKVTLGGEFIVSFLLFDTLSKLENNWQKLSSFLSESLEEYFIDDFSRWNFYIIYLCKEPVRKELQYKIENNPFFARKIVEGAYSEELIDEDIKKLISDHINFIDLKIYATQPVLKAYESSSEIYLKLKNKSSISESQIDELLKSLEGIINEI